MTNMTFRECVDLLSEAGVETAGRPPEEVISVVNIEHINQFSSLKRARRPGKSGIPIAASGRETTGELPPWGQMSDSLMADIEPVIPYDFNLPDGNEPSLRDFVNWLIDVIGGIDTLIWPLYKPGSGNWADAKVGALFDADFSLLAVLRQNFGFPIRGALATTVQHGDFFTREDNPGLCFGTGYEHYDSSLSRQDLDCLPTVMTAGIVDKVGSIDLLLKWFFQRPRAHQVAWIQKRHGFTYESANTASSPSLVSGHCLQGSLAGCTAFDALEQLDLQILQQFTVDIGDRRVFAGVHYPSDNLSSWFTALKLLPYVFKPDRVSAVRNFLWSAIDQKSLVFREIKRHVNANEHSPYARMVEELRLLGSEVEVPRPGRAQTD